MRRNPHRSLAFYRGGRLVALVASLLCQARPIDKATHYKAFLLPITHQVDLKSSRFGFCPEVGARVVRRG
jgi:hypothetical protein